MIAITSFLSYTDNVRLHCGIGIAAITRETEKAGVKDVTRKVKPAGKVKSVGNVRTAGKLQPSCQVFPSP